MSTTEPTSFTPEPVVQPEPVTVETAPEAVAWEAPAGTAAEPTPTPDSPTEAPVVVGGPVAQPTNQPTPEQVEAADCLEDKHTPAESGDPLLLGFTPAGEEGPTLGITQEQHDAAIAAAARQLAPEHERGFRGFNPDPNPNEYYTVAGVTGSL